MSKFQEEVMLSVVRMLLMVLVFFVVSAVRAEDYSAVLKDKMQQMNAVPYDSHQGFRENIDFYTGRLILSQTDLALPGNGPDIVVERRLTAANLPGPIGAWEYDWRSINSMADWELVTPHLEVFVPFQSYANGLPPSGYRYERSTQWNVNAADQGARCTNFASIPNYRSTMPVVGVVESHHWWTGLKMELPGNETQEILLRAPENSTVPTMTINGTTRSFNLVTNRNWMVTCLPSLRNAGFGGEGFLVVDMTGTKYFFDWMAFKGINVIGTAFKSGSAWSSLPLWGTKVLLLATRVEDRFGNYVNYNYEGERLVSVTSSDGRRVEFQWTVKAWGPPDPVRGFTSGDFHHLAGFTAQPRTTAARTWSYDYQLAQHGTKARRDSRLRRMIQPDGSVWTYALDNIVSGCFYLMGSSSVMNHDCARTSPHTSSVTTPSGATTTYEFVSSVKKRYAQSMPAEQAVFDRVEIGTYRLTSKRLTGPGVSGTWTYTMTGDGTPYSYHMTLNPDGSQLTRKIDAIHRSTTEGQILQTQLFRRVGDANPVRSQSFEYASAEGQAYPARVGLNVQRWGGSNLEVYRPLRKSIITQDGVNFTRETLEFDHFARERVVRSTSSP
ncbi:hypothetical protein CV100_16150 [Stenotrophomonas maltophilia]|nr:hypothetical protein CV100_16150 [Stenotrophomonas maltophilia]